METLPVDQLLLLLLDRLLGTRRVQLSNHTLFYRRRRVLVRQPGGDPLVRLQGLRLHRCLLF